MRRYSLARHTGGTLPDRHYVNGKSVTRDRYDEIRNAPGVRLDTMHTTVSGKRVSHYTSVTITE